jgi:hypothetical protein
MLIHIFIFHIHAGKEMRRIFNLFFGRNVCLVTIPFLPFSIWSKPTLFSIGLTFEGIWLKFLLIRLIQASNIFIASFLLIKRSKKARTSCKQSNKNHFQLITRWDKKREQYKRETNYVFNVFIAKTGEKLGIEVAAWGKVGVRSPLDASF